MMRDAEFGMLRLRAFGIYSFSVEDPGKFMKEVFGTNSMFTVDDVSGHRITSYNVCYTKLLRFEFLQWPRDNE